MTRALLWIGDLFERGVPDDAWDLNRWQMLCFNISQWLYALAWRVGKLDQAR